jgi:hypothetical protein
MVAGRFAVNQSAGLGVGPNDAEDSRRSPMSNDPEVEWHREQIAKNRALLEELEGGNTAGGDVFPETASEIERLRAQIAQSELIVASYDKHHPG